VLTIGTAGHIDHGKSSLVKALSAIDPDRLPEEKRRGMTIDLGFAWMDLPCGETVGIIDVPGHKQFVHNVIPGLFSIDASLLVVAADDGWMLQTEEHLRILDLLGVRHGIIALNKIDLTESAEWLEMLEKDISVHLAGTGLEHAPIMRVSARSGEGIAELKQAIAAMAHNISPRQDIGKPRLPIDRVFVIKGSGVVVTGTSSQGVFQTGSEVNIIPSGLTARIRNLENFKKNSCKGTPGGRAALNLASVKRTDIRRGDIVTAIHHKPSLSRIIDTQLTLLTAAETPLKSISEVLVYLETRELLGRVSLIGNKSLHPGESSLAQLRFREDIASFIGERFIVRRQSPPRTIGGGIVLDPQAEKVKLADMPSRAAFLRKRLTLELDELILSEVSKNGWAKMSLLLINSMYSSDEITAHVIQLAYKKLLVTSGDWAVMPVVWQESCLKLLALMETIYKTNPLQAGIPHNAIQGVIGLPHEVFDALVQHLSATGKLLRRNDMLYLPGNKATLSPQQESIKQELLNKFTAQVSAPPTLSEIEKQSAANMPVTHYLIKQGLLINIGDGVLFEQTQFERICVQIMEMLKRNGRISIQDINQKFGLSRKYSVPLLAYLDRLGYTCRRDNVRVPGRKLT